MKKKSKLLTLILTILCIVLISIISFGGVFVQDKNAVKNILPQYVLAKDLKGYRMVELKAEEVEEETENETENTENGEEEQAENSQNTEEEPKVEESAEEGNKEEASQEENKEESKNEDKKKERQANYKKSKEIIEKRLKSMNVTNYIIRQNKENGNIVLELPENNDTDRVVGEFSRTGKFEILDSETQEVLIDNNDIESVKAGYGQNAVGSTVVFINIQFNKEGTAKFKDITNTYIQTTVTKEKEETENAQETENTEETNTEETASQEETENNTETITKQVTVKLDDQEMLSTYFTTEVSNGLFQLTMGTSGANTQVQLQEYMNEALSLSTILNLGKLPVNYEVVQNKYIAANITNKLVATIIIVPSVILLVGFVYIIVKYKGKGILASISMIGYVALLLLAVRYCNVPLSFGGIIAILFSILLSYLMIVSMLKEERKIKAIGKWCIILVPTVVLSEAFVFTNVLIGAVLF